MVARHQSWTTHCNILRFLEKWSFNNSICLFCSSLCCCAARLQQSVQQTSLKMSRHFSTYIPSPPHCSTLSSHTCRLFVSIKEFQVLIFYLFHKYKEKNFASFAEYPIQGKWNKTNVGLIDRLNYWILKSCILGPLL